MKRIVMTQALCREGYDMLEKVGSITVANNGNPSDYPEMMQDAECIVVRIGHMTRNEIENAPQLKVIGRSGVGYDSIDVEAANEQGIPIVITPHANADSVAEHTLAMMLALASDLVENHNETLRGNYGVRNSGKSFELHGKMVGVIGLGDIGKRVARLCLTMNMGVCAYDPHLTKEDMNAVGVQFCTTLLDLLHQSDIVTVHTPLDETTKGMIGDIELQQMKQSAVLVNCARGGIVVEDALLRALEQGVIAGAAIDVMVNEPMQPDDPLFAAPNLIVSPHSAAQTREATVRSATMCAQGCIAILNGERWPHVANPEAYQHPRWQK